jgi:hypothetical protein
MKQIKKLVPIFVLVLIGLYAILTLSLLYTPRDGFINKFFRPTLTSSRITRAVFFLDDWGDARYDFFGKNINEIIIEIDYQQDRYPSSGLQSKIEEKLSKVTGRNITVKIGQDKDIPDLKAFDTKYLKNELIGEAIDFRPTKIQKHIHVFILSRSSQNPSQTATTLGSKAIAVFQDRIKELSDDSSIASDLEAAIILNQIGKLWGFDYLDRPQCIMFSELINQDKTVFDRYNVATDFCPESLVKLDEIIK